MEYIIVWPDGAWCYPDELHEMQHRGDDYIKIGLVDADYEEQDIDHCAYIASYSFGEDVCQQ